MRAPEYYDLRAQGTEQKISMVGIKRTTAERLKFEDQLCNG